jgi:hypothetical protein
LRQKKIRLLLIKVLQQVSKKIKFAYFPFANKNVFEENLTYNKVVCLEVFITKQGFGEPLKISFAYFLRSKASLKLALLLFQQN